MATKLDENELVSFKELLMSNEIYLEAIVQLLVDKGVFTKQELLGKIKQIQADMIKSQGS
jgi:hypothetical protein